MKAAENGTQVAVLVEVKARADEAANIRWARELERAGAHVAYGLVGLKTHAKIALVVRREPDGLRRYVHVGTGNYNSKTARLYTDLGLISCDDELGADVTDLFNVLTGLSQHRRYRRLLVAPYGLRAGFLELVERERRHAEAGRPARIVVKVNHLVDRECIDALYTASQAGVEVELIVRSRCSLRPGVPGLSERIVVRSIVGELLEHSRIFRFENGGDPEWYVGSADLMERNLDRRIEAYVRVVEPAARARLEEIVGGPVGRRSAGLAARRRRPLAPARGTARPRGDRRRVRRAEATRARERRRARLAARSCHPEEGRRGISAVAVHTNASGRRPRRDSSLRSE